MSGGGSPSTPSTTTQVSDIPEWERGYVTDLLGRATAISNQPYQQFQGPQVAGFTDNQNQAFSNITGAGATNAANQAAALGQVQAGANTANNIYNAGAGNINASTGYNPLMAVSPYLGSASQYNSASAAHPWLNQAANYQSAAAQAGTPQSIQSYMSPYTNSVVQGIQNQANQNWNQNIMPGVNDKFVGSGQYGSGRNAQVLGQAAGNFQTGLSANVANALESGYNTAGTQAANQAQLLSGLGSQALTGAGTASGAQTSQISNLINQANTAGTAANQQAANLQGAGTALGNLTATQGTQQLAAGTTLGNLGAQQASTDLTQNQALQAVGQQQQQLNQTNLNTAMQNWQNQVNYPAQQTEYLNQIIRGLPAPTSTTSSTQTTPAYSTSPLSAIGGAGIGALSLAGANGNPLGTVTGAKEGGLIKGYAAGGVVSIDDEMSPLDYFGGDDPDDYDTGDNGPISAASFQSVDVPDSPQIVSDESTPLDSLAIAQNNYQQEEPTPISPQKLDTPASQHNSTAPDGMQYNGLTQADVQQQRLLALAAGMLQPSLGGSTAAAFGQGLNNLGEVERDQNRLMMEQAARNERMGIEHQNADERKRLSDWRMSQGVGAYDTIASKLMKDNPNLTYSQALTIARNRSETIPLANSKKSSLPTNLSSLSLSPVNAGTIPLAQLMKNDGTGGNDYFNEIEKPSSSNAPITIPLGDESEDMKPGNSYSYLTSTDGTLSGTQNAIIPSKLSGQTFIDAVAEKDPDRARLIQGVGDNQINLTNILSRMKPEEKTSFTSDVIKYRPDFSQNGFSAMKAFTQGKQGDVIRSANTAQNHLAILNPIVDALNNGDVQTFNKLGNAASQQFGGVPISDLNTVKGLIGGEIAKVAIGTKSGESEREDIVNQINAAKSPEQLKSSIKRFQELMAGQVDSLKTQFKGSTRLGDKDFYSLLTPASLQAYKVHNPQSGDTDAAAPFSAKNPLNARINQKNSTSSPKVATTTELAETARKYGKSIDQVRKDAINAGYTIQ